MRVLVTGSSGRLGFFVVSELERAGHQVVLFDQRPPGAAFSHLPSILGHTANFEDCRRALAGGMDAIQHLAAQPYPTDHPQLRQRAEHEGLPFDATMRSNLLGTYYLLQAALAADVPIFVMTSSNCALGHNFRISDRPFPFRYLPVDEEHPTDVEDSYSFSKIAGEQLLASYTRAYGMRTYAVRASAICDLAQRREIARQARPAVAWNAGLWAWAGAEDVAVAHRLLMEQAYQIESHGVFFCNADDTSALEPSLALVEQLNPDLLPLVGDLPGHASFQSNRKLKEAVGWRHQTSWREHLPERRGQ